MALVLARPVRLGLDLRGGTQIVLEAQDTERTIVDRETVDRTVEVLRRRVDQLGVAEPTLASSGDRRIIVELPGVTDPDEALEVIGRTAQLTFHQVLEDLPPAAPDEAEPTPAPDPTAERVLTDEDGRRVRLGDARITGDAVASAQGVFEPGPPGQWVVDLEFRGDGAREWANLTGEAACASLGEPQRRVAIVLDDEVISSPQVSPEVQCDVGITGGRTIITGGPFDEDEARNLGLLIQAGALPVPVEVVEQRTVGPTLGEAAIASSTEAVLIGALLTILFLLLYYRLLGALAAIALLSYGMIAFAVLLALQATLTLPGIAGFVLAVGMAVDANILVFERMKEEHATGLTFRSASQRGFSHAISAIVDSNVTTLLAAALLFFFAAGPVRGFGVTLSVGVVVSMFSALVVTRVLIDATVRGKKLNARPKLVGIEMGARLRSWLTERAPDLMGRRNLWFAIGGIAVVLAVGGLGIRGLNLGVEFTGGRLIEYEVQEAPDLNRIRSELAGVGFPRAVVQESGEGNVAVRTGVLDDEQEEAVEGAVSEVMGPVTRVREEFIGPTIGQELRRAALIALAIALAAQLLYIAIRFRWTFGASAVVAMAHDVMILLGVFAWLGKDIDGVFLAALLTVIGYSVNDSVVIFDRIREYRAKRRKEQVSVVANSACLETLPRTINTGLSTLFILFALFFLGGETLTDFALALIIGIVVGTYSSVFIASPLYVTLERAMPATVVAKAEEERAEAVQRHKQRKKKPGRKR